MPPSGYGFGGGGVGYEPSYEHHEIHHENPSKALGLKDLFDIALTTLAFLSFGLFILQVLMCISMKKMPANAGMVFMPNNGMNEGGEETDMVGKRSKRDINRFDTDVRRNIPILVKILKSSFLQINDIARRVLNSIDAALMADKDNGKCLQQLICENNKFARSRADSQKVWIPVWG